MANGKAFAATFKAGDLLTEGVVVSEDAAGVLVGRLVEEHEVLPLYHTEHRIGAVRVFLSNNQAPIPPTALHKGKALTDRDKAEADKATVAKAGA